VCVYVCMCVCVCVYVCVRYVRVCACVCVLRAWLIYFILNLLAHMPEVGEVLEAHRVCGGQISGTGSLSSSAELQNRSTTFPAPVRVEACLDCKPARFHLHPSRTQANNSQTCMFTKNVTVICVNVWMCGQGLTACSHCSPRAPPQL